MKHYSIEKVAITIAFDCDLALKMCAKSDPLSIKIKSFDILQDIRNRLDMLPIEVSSRWVEGHKKKKEKQWTGGREEILTWIWQPKHIFENAGKRTDPLYQYN